MIKTPTVMQMDAVECGAAALGIILAYHGAYIPLEKLRVSCGVSRDGSKAKNLIKAAAQHHLQPQAVKVAELHQFEPQYLPCILFWQFDHFIVLEGIKKNKVFINDPATGPRQISIDEFNQGFTGVALLFKKSPDFQHCGRPSSVYKELKNYLSGSHAGLLYALITSLVTVLPTLVIAGSGKVLIDEIFVGKNGHWIYPLLLTIFLATTLKACLEFLKLNSLMRLQAKIGLLHASRFLWHLLRVPLHFFYQRFNGDIQDRLHANDRISDLLSQDLNTSLISCINIVFFGLILILLHPLLGGIIVLLASLNAIIFRWLTRKMADHMLHFLQQRGKLLGMAMHGVQIIESLNASNSKEGFLNQLFGLQSKTLNIQQRVMFYSQFLVIIPKLINFSIQIVLLGLGALLVIQGQLTLGVLFALQLLIGEFINPIQQVLGFGEKIQLIRADLSRLIDVQNQPWDQRYQVKKPLNDVDLDLSGQVSLQDISFGYSPLDPPFYQNINLNIPAGKKVAIVGQTGCGKSTLASLCSGLYQPWSGQVQLDDHPMTQLTPQEIASTISLVDQNILLFAGTVRENLTLWNNFVAESHLEWALNVVGLYQYFDERDGIDTELIDNGMNLSGGQRQRLEIARALVSEPKLLILDEATSALDTLAEKSIFQALMQTKMTIMIISHRLSAIRDCDSIFVINNGRLENQGTHAFLMAHSPTYQDLVRSET